MLPTANAFCGTGAYNHEIWGTTNGFLGTAAARRLREQVS